MTPDRFDIIPVDIQMRCAMMHLAAQCVDEVLQTSQCQQSFKLLQGLSADVDVEVFDSSPAAVE